MQISIEGIHNILDDILPITSSLENIDKQEHKTILYSKSSKTTTWTSIYDAKSVDSITF